MAIMATICPWKSVCTVLVESATSVYNDICVSQKTWPPLPNEFENLLDKVNRGRSERNLMGLFGLQTQRSEINLTEIGHWGAISHFSRGVNYCTSHGFLHMHSIFIYILGFSVKQKKKNTAVQFSGLPWPIIIYAGSHVTLQPKTDCPLKLSRAEPGQYLDGRPPGKTRLLLEEVFVRPAGGAHPAICVGPNTPV